MLDSELRTLRSRAAFVFFVVPVGGRHDCQAIGIGDTQVDWDAARRQFTERIVGKQRQVRPLRLAVVEGAVVGGGLTVIANAPNPAGQALLGRFFDGAVSPIGLAAGALLPTLIAAAVFRLL
jgi:hypothetical protein